MNMQYTAPRTVARTEVTNAFLRSVYNWMALGLALTGAVAVGVAHSPAVQEVLVRNPLLVWGCLIAEIGLVLYLSAAIKKLSGGAATGLFLIYSALNGVTLGLILMAYTQQSVAQAFFTSTGMFAAMSVYGLYTKRDLASMGGFLMMGVWGLVFASLINLFVGSTMLEFGISCVGVVVFMGLTAYYTQFLKEMGLQVPKDDPTAVRRATIIGALQLYLAFINLFLMMLRLMGNRR